MKPIMLTPVLASCLLLAACGDSGRRGEGTATQTMRSFVESGQPRRRELSHLGLTPVSFEGKWGYMDANYSEGLARFRVGSQWGYVDTEGKIVINPTFPVSHFGDSWDRIDTGEGRSVYRERPSGSYIIDYDFEGARDFHSGRAAVRVPEGTGFIDKRGSGRSSPFTRTSPTSRKAWRRSRPAGGWGTWFRPGRS
jgi:hypothetical protein